MLPTLNQDKVRPESFRILFRKYLTKPEAKSLAPDGTLRMGTSQGLLQRATITAENIVPVGKETDRRWEQGEDPSMIDSDVYTYEKLTKMVVVDVAERRRLAAIGIRRLKRESKLSQAPISNAIHEIPIKLQTLAIIRQAARDSQRSNGTNSTDTSNPMRMAGLWHESHGESKLLRRQEL
jgi:hypothetical protein